MPIKAAICDDSPEALHELSEAAAAWAKQEKEALSLETFSSAEPFLFRYEERPDFDVLLLDIEMPGENGVELAKRIRRENDRIQIVFITGYPDFIAEGYDVAALHYLMKPVSRQKLGEVLSRAAENLRREERAVLLSTEGAIRRVPAGRVLLVEAFAHSCTVTTEKEEIPVRESITAVEEKLRRVDAGAFIRTHRSCLVGIRYIQSLSKTEVTLDNGRRVPLSRSHYQAVHQAFMRWFKGETSWD